MTDSILVHGMHGMGDNIHQRAIIRELLKRGFRIKLETSWPCVYHDLAGENLSFIRKPVALRTQLKNAERERAAFVPGPPEHHVGRSLRISYNRSTVAASASKTILEAMFIAAGMPEAFADADFRLPIPETWLPVPIVQAQTPAKPIMIYRPLVVRPEWRGSGIRNADPNAYAELVGAIRDSYFVVSVADLEPNREWIVGPHLEADATYHGGELPFETLAATFAAADLVYTSGGFPGVLGLAVGTPVVSVIGGFEPAGWLAAGSKFAPYLGIQPINPCGCATSNCNKPCLKEIDLPRAREALIGFSSQIGVPPASESRPWAEMFTPATATPQPGPHSVPRRMPRVVGGPLRPGNPGHLYLRRPPVKA